MNYAHKLRRQNVTLLCSIYIYMMQAEVEVQSCISQSSCRSCETSHGDEMLYSILCEADLLVKQMRLCSSSSSSIYVQQKLVTGTCFPISLFDAVYLSGIAVAINGFTTDLRASSACRLQGLIRVPNTL